MIKVIKDCKCSQGFTIFEGSVIQEAKPLKQSFKGLWASPYGTYIVTVKKKCCKISR